MSAVLIKGSSRASKSRVVTDRGFTLIELMIAMVLGLVVAMGVVGVTSSNGQNYRISEGVAELQENLRTSFELLARDIRAARDTGCGPVPVTTTDVYPAPTAWWQSWEPVRGFGDSEASDAVSFGANLLERVAGTAALQLQGTNDGWPLRNLSPTAVTVTTVNGHNIEANNLAVLCDLENQAAMLHQITGTSNSTIDVDPETSYASGQLAAYWATTWYIGNNNRPGEGGRSLYRARYDQAGGNVVREEMLPGIIDMRIRYRINEDADFVTADLVAQWNSITAIEITLTSQTTSRNVVTEAGAGVAVGANNRLLRTSTNVVALRNRP